MNLENQFRVILKAAKIRSALNYIIEKKHQVVRAQRFDEAAALRDREKLLNEKLEAINEEMVRIYEEHFPEESREIDKLLENL